MNSLNHLARDVDHAISTLKLRHPLDLIIEAVAAELNLTPRVITSTSRTAPIPEARHLIWWLARELTGATHDHIGQAFSPAAPLHHTTITYGLHATRNLMEVYPTIRTRNQRLLEHLEAKLNL